MFSVWCQLCNIRFEHNLELEVHQLSLSHHIKLETAAPGLHNCHTCGVTCSTLGEYSKHVDTLEHRKRRDRLRAIIDTMDASQGQAVNNCDFVNREGRQDARTSNYDEHSISFFSGKDRLWRTNAPPNRFSRLGMFYSQGGENPSRPSSGIRQKKLGDGRPFHEQHSSHLLQSDNAHRFEEDRYLYMGNKAIEKRVDEHMCDESLNRDRSNVQKGRNAEECSLFLENSSPSLCGRMGKVSTSRSTSSENKKFKKRDKKQKKKKSLNLTPSSSSAGCSTMSNGNTVEVAKRVRGAPLGVSMNDKTKKWELVAVKGKASYLKNRSQRMLKDRMSKFRLVDSKGVVVEEMHEEEPSTLLKESRFSSSAANDATVSHLSSPTMETAQEAAPKSYRKQFDGKTSICVSATALVPEVFPISSAKDCGDGLQAYEKCQGFSTGDVEVNMDVQLGKMSCNSSSTTNKNALEFDAVHCSSGTLPGNSSMAFESRPLTSHMGLMSLPNLAKSSGVVTVKEELPESPPPDVLPSPPQFDQKDASSFASNRVKIAGEKERQEFWLLGIAELKKGHEIHAARMKIENLQKALFEATSDLRRIEVEMNEILRRKSELLGLSVPNTFL